MKYLVECYLDTFVCVFYIKISFLKKKNCLDNLNYYTTNLCLRQIEKTLMENLKFLNSFDVYATAALKNQQIY